MRGGYQIVDLSGAIVGTETKVGGVYKTISGFDGKPVFIITPNTSGVFAEFTENSGMYIGAYIGSNSHLFTVSIISSDYVTIIDKGPAGGGGTSNYNELSNKPAIDGTTLSGDKSLSDLGIQGALTAGTNISISEGNEISANVSSMTAANVTFDNTGSGMSANDVQDAITELNSNITYKRYTITVTASSDVPGYSKTGYLAIPQTDLTAYGRPISLTSRDLGLVLAYDAGTLHVCTSRADNTFTIEVVFAKRITYVG